MKPRIPITSREFVYFDSANTSVARTFARVRAEIQAAADARAAEAAAAHARAYPEVRLRKVGAK